MKMDRMKKALLTSGLGLATLFGAVTFVQAQTWKDYRDAQKEQRKEMREQQKDQRREARRVFRRYNNGYRDQYGTVFSVNRNGYYVDQLGNVYDRNGYVVSSSGNRVIVNPSYGYNNNYGYNTGVQTYRLYRNGSYYNVDSRGYESLRSAVNTGYQQGYYEGQRDRSQGKRYNYADEDAYRAASRGYNSYVDNGQYNYYFREGFRRGYEDGFYSRYQYGYNTNGSVGIIGSILNTILNVSQY
jgi:hypothetical protein